MERRIKKSIKAIEISGIRRFNELAKTKQDIVFFTIGEPYFNTPENIKESGIYAITENKTFYTQNQGCIEFRNAVSNYVRDNYRLEYHSNEVVSTVGSMEALSSALFTILEFGDEVIIPTPCYPGYAPLIAMNDAKVVEMNTKEDNFQISKESLERCITDKTKAILITTPNNPSGIVYNKKSIENIRDVIKNRDIFVISDEVYRDIVYEKDSFVSIAEYQEIREKVIMISGFSKSHSMTGWRIGYLLAAENIIKHIVKTHQYLVTSTSTISQNAAIEAMKTRNDTMLEHYKTNRFFGEKILKELGLNIVEPMGAFYFFISISQFGLRSLEFCTQLLDFGVACVPGEYFGESFDDYIRLSYACSFKELEKGLGRLEKYISSIQA